MDRFSATTAAEAVKRLRVELDISQRELAAELRVDHALIGRIEAGREPDLATLRRLLAPFGGRLELVVSFDAPLGPVASDLRAARARRKERLDQARVARNWERRRLRAQLFLSRK